MRSKWVIAALALMSAAGCRPRTEVMLGVITDLLAPGAFDLVKMRVERDGVTVLDESWEIPGTRTGKFILPGSYGVHSSDGSAPRVNIELTGWKGNQVKITRKSITSLVSEKTLFMRMGLVGGCIDRSDCADELSCVEGRCRPTLVDVRRLRELDSSVIAAVQCQSGAVYVDTSSGTPLPRLGNDSCPDGQYCEEGTCYNDIPEVMVGQALWLEQSTPTQFDLHGIFGMAVGPAYDVFAVGDGGTVLHLAPASASAATTWASEQTGTLAHLYAVWGMTPTQLYAVGAGGTILTRNASGWAQMMSGTTDDLKAVWGSAVDDVWAAGGTATGGATLLHWDGKSWSRITDIPQGSGSLRAIFGTRRSDVWLAGQRGTLLHFDGIGWRKVAAPPSDPPIDFLGVSGETPAGGQIFVSGTRGRVYRLDGPNGTLTAEPSGTTLPLNAVFALSKKDVFHVGDFGTIVQSEGAGWRSLTLPGPVPLDGVWGASAIDVYAVGRSGTVVHYGGERVAPEDGGALPDMSMAGDMAKPFGIGFPCAADKDCPAGKSPVCFTQELGNVAGGALVPGGYCSSACTTDADCAPDGLCIDVAGIGAFCLHTCNAPNQCRTPDYACLKQGGCYPDSAVVRDCDPQSGDGSCTVPGPGVTGGCVRQVLGGGMSGRCEMDCEIGTGTCPTIGGIFKQHCVVVDTTGTPGDKWKGPLCVGLLANPVPDGQPCLDSASGSFSDEVCADGLQCDLAGDKKCHMLCLPAPMAGAVPDGGVVAGSCGAGVCTDYWMLLGTPRPAGLCL